MGQVIAVSIMLTDEQINAIHAEEGYEEADLGLWAKETLADQVEYDVQLGKDNAG